MNAPSNMPPSSHADEDRRLAALHALDLLDSEPEKAFDALVALTAQRFDCPVSMLSLVDRDRQWIKAKTGIVIDQTPRDIAFCDHTIRSGDPLVVPDSLADPRFATNPLVTADNGIRFYAGAPIHASNADGRHAIGALCVIDSKPHDLDPVQQQALTHLASIAEALIASRAAAHEAIAIADTMQENARILRRQERVFTQVERMARIGSWRLDLRDDTLTWSDGVYRIHELNPADDPDLRRALDHYPPRDRALLSAALAHTIESGTPHELELDFDTAKGSRRRVRVRGELEMERGVPLGIVGVFHDITESYRVERKLRESASTDEVTRIANRAEFNRVLEAALQAARAGPTFVLILLDLDGFKETNDAFGHLAGDDVLRAMGQRLRAPFLKDSFAARLGGDEFGLIVTDPALVDSAPVLIERLLDHLKNPVQSNDALLSVSATIGSAMPGPGRDTIRDLMHAADAALYSAKRARRGTAHAYVAPFAKAG